MSSVSNCGDLCTSRYKSFLKFLLHKKMCMSMWSPDGRGPFSVITQFGPPPLGALEIGGCLRLCGIWVVKVPRNRGDR